MYCIYDLLTVAHVAAAVEGAIGPHVAHGYLKINSFIGWMVWIFKLQTEACTSTPGLLTH